MNASVIDPTAVELRLWDAQWLNIVNSDFVQYATSIDEAVYWAVKQTEDKMAQNIRLNNFPGK